MAGQGRHETMTDSDELAALRETLANLQGLLVVSMLMSDSGDESRILELATTALPSLGETRLAGAYLLERGWHTAAGTAGTDAARLDIEAQLAVLSVAGGAVSVRGANWSWAFPMRSASGHFGFFVVRAAGAPSADELFLLRVLAQQAGIAIANARLHGRDEATAVELRALNSALKETVDALERGNATHARLTQVAATRQGQQGIADALRELTGYSIAVMDRHGTVEAWAGDGEPTIVARRGSKAERERVLREADAAGRPLRDGDCVISVAQPQAGLIGVICLYDPDRTSGPAEEMALEHASTVLAVELFRLFGEAAAEQRAGGDLVEELLGGAIDDRTLRQARALGMNLRALRRVVIVEDPEHRDSASLYEAVRRLAQSHGAGGPLVVRHDAVILLAEGDVNWPLFRTHVQAETRGRCRVAVGGLCREAADYPRSYREARAALGILDPTTDGDRAAVFDDLGVYQLLMYLQDTAAIHEFCRQWLGRLIDHDENRNAALVSTLTRYLTHGGSYDGTAAALLIHRSTLRYRLQQIREITGFDLSDPEVAFNLGLATRAWTVVRALGEQSDD